MYEKVHPARMLTEFKLPEKSYVLVNKFNEESFASLIKDSEEVIKTGQDFLPIVIDSYGGYCHSLFGMIDFLAHVDIPVITVAVGKAMSCGALLLSSGQERYVAPNASIMVHEIITGAWGKMLEVSNSTKESKRINMLLFKLLDRNTDHKSGYWREMCDKNKNADVYLTANQCIKHNLATQIGIPHIETTIEVRRELVI